jgi:hypothetical protein
VASADTTIRAAALYRLFDTTERLLYVGVAFTPSARFTQHARTKVWWQDVAAKHVEWFESRAAAEDAEKSAIRTEGPLYNIVVSDESGCAQFAPRTDGRAWGRPPWSPTPEQIQILGEAAEAFQGTERAWATLAEAVALGVPKDRLPEYVPHSRATVLRKLANTVKGTPTTNGRKRKAH